MQFTDFTGQQIGQLTVLSIEQRNPVKWRVLFTYIQTTENHS